MKTLSAALAVLALLTWDAACQADITGASMTCDCSGRCTCNSHDFSCVAPGEYQLFVDCTENNGDTGSLAGDFTSDTASDQKLTLLHQMVNGAGTAWNGYSIDLAMTTAFSLDNVTVGDSGWASVVTQPVEYPDGSWRGSIDYAGGVAVDPSSALNFAYRMTFGGSATLVEHVTPSMVDVPEPTTFALAAFGLMGLMIVRRKFAR